VLEAGEQHYKKKTSVPSRVYSARPRELLWRVIDDMTLGQVLRENIREYESWERQRTRLLEKEGTGAGGLPR